MRVIYYLLIVFCLFVQVSCEVINPDEDIPGYLLIEEFDLQTNFGTEGTSSQKISELWVYANGEYMGAYDLPAEVPILKEGQTNITVFPGIRNNGIAASRIVYPFYTAYETTVNLVPGQNVSVTPSFSYKENLEFWFENFDDPGIKLSASSASDTTLDVTIDSGLVFEGSGSGVVHLTADTSYFFARTQEGIDLPGGQQIFLELNYKSTNSFAVGLEAYSSGSVDRSAALIILPSTGSGIAVWNKIYVELSFIAGSFPNADFFALYIESFIDPGRTDSEIYFDNLKIVHFD